MKKNENISETICPKCGKPYRGRPALSREDNYTSICSECGTRESLASINLSEEETEEIIAIMRKAHAI